MKRFVALLCAMMLLTSAIACGKAEPAITTVATTSTAPDATSEATEATTPAETEPPKAFDTVPAQNLGGDFHILYSTTDQSLADFTAETLNGDIKNDLIYERNSMVEEKLGIDVMISPMGYTDLNAECQRQVQAGGDDYDMFGGHRNSLVLSYQGFHYNLLEIDALNLEQFMSFGIVYAGENDMVMYDVPSEDVWELMIFDRSLVNVYDQEEASKDGYGSRLIRASVYARALGYWNISLSLTDRGYMTTNIGSTGKAFYIGKDKVAEIISVIETYERTENYVWDPAKEPNGPGQNAVPEPEPGTPIGYGATTLPYDPRA